MTSMRAKMVIQNLNESVRALDGEREWLNKKFSDILTLGFTYTVPASGNVETMRAKIGDINLYVGKTSTGLYPVFWDGNRRKLERAGFFPESKEGYMVVYDKKDKGGITSHSKTFDGLLREIKEGLRLLKII